MGLLGGLSMAFALSIHPTSVNLVHNALVELPLARSFLTRAPHLARSFPACASPRSVLPRPCWPPLPHASPVSPFPHPPKHSTGNKSQWAYAK